MDFNAKAVLWRLVGNARSAVALAYDSGELCKLARDLLGIELTHADIDDIKRIAGETRLERSALVQDKLGTYRASGYTPPVLPTDKPRAERSKYRAVPRTDGKLDPGYSPVGHCYKPGNRHSRYVNYVETSAQRQEQAALAKLNKSARRKLRQKT